LHTSTPTGIGAVVLQNLGMTSLCAQTGMVLRFSRPDDLLMPVIRGTLESHRRVGSGELYRPGRRQSKSNEAVRSSGS